MKLFIFTKKQILVVGCAFLSVILGAVISVNVFAKAQRLLPIYSVGTEEKKIAISFDAAWGADDTDTLIEILKKYNVPATFFVVGQWVDKYPEEVKKLSEAGHDVMNHSATHPYMTSLSKEKMIAELNTCNDKIEAVTGKRPSLFRCPYGDYNNAVISAVDEIGMHTIQWDVDSLDWKESATVDSIVARVTSKVQNGSIVLFHNDAEHTPQALPIILEKLISEGYTFVKIADFIYYDEFTIDHQGKQIPNEKIKKDGE